ncbi:hypothetical protein LEMLEM_LOCUS11123 [Lemmus lemmus]
MCFKGKILLIPTTTYEQQVTTSASSVWQEQGVHGHPYVPPPSPALRIVLWNQDKFRRKLLYQCHTQWPSECLSMARVNSSALLGCGP